MKETDLMRQIQIRASELGHRLWRNNIGFCHNPKMTFGLCPGSADLIGLTKDGQFLAIEVKSPRGKPSQEQLDFATTVRRLGGIAIICRSVKAFEELF